MSDVLQSSPNRWVIRFVRDFNACNPALAKISLLESRKVHGLTWTVSHGHLHELV